LIGNERRGLTVRSLGLNRTLVAAAAAAPTAVFAHSGAADVHDLVHGFMHPVGGVDHVLAMVAVGVVAAQLGGRALWAVPMSFVAAMTIAAAIGMLGLALPGLEAGIALSLIVLGALISLRVKLPIALAAATVASFAVFHGYSHGLEMGDARSGVVFGVGFVSATALLHLLGIGVGLTVERAASREGERLAQAGGGALALAGVVLLAGGLA
jgi:urease accessory protein